MKRRRIGLQLHTVRDEMGKNVEATIRKVAAIGYDEVEFAGYFGETPSRIRSILDECGLDSPAAHFSYEAFEREQDRMIDDALAIGHRYLVLAGLPRFEVNSIEAYERWVQRFNEYGERARKAGLIFAYHNHDFEFTPIDRKVPLELLIGGSDPRLVAFELDTYWVKYAGWDSGALFKKFPNRFPLLHLKDMDNSAGRRSVEVGSGTIDFKLILSDSSSGMRHSFVEQEHFSTSTIESVERSYRNLRSMNLE